MDSRLTRAISTPRIQQHASELVRLALRALDDLRQLDESLYERFLETRNAPEDSEAATQRMRKLWDDTFRGLRELLTYSKTVLGERKQKVIDKVVEEVSGMRRRAQEFEENPELVRGIVAEGAEKAREAARQTLDEVRRSMNLRAD